MHDFSGMADAGGMGYPPSPLIGPWPRVFGCGAGVFNLPRQAVFLLYYHLVLVVKYRRKVFDDIVSARAREIFEYIAPKYGITVEEWNHDMDHVHVLFRAQPKSELSKFINAYKSASSRLLKQEFPQIRQKLWKEYFWSRSFCLLTTGGAPIEVIRKYIENQGRK